MSSFLFGYNDFTIEFFISFNSLSNQNILTAYNNSTFTEVFSIFLLSNVIVLYINQLSRVSPLLTSSLTMNINTWYHIAFIRKGNTYTIFINGINYASNINTNNYYINSTNIIIGNDINNLYNKLNGYIDNLRVTNGIPRYINNFTIPSNSFPTNNYIYNANLLSQAYSLSSATSLSTSYTIKDIDSSYGVYYINTSLLYHLDDISFNDSSKNKLNCTINGSFSYSNTSLNIGTIKSGSVLFNNNYIRTPNTTKNSTELLTFGYKNFTIEFWINFVANNSPILSFYSDTNTFYWSVNITSNNNIYIYFNTNNTSLYSNTILSLNTWYNIAIVRNNDFIMLYINGILDNTINFTISIDSNNSHYMLLGYSTFLSIVSNSYLNAYMKEFRITKGICRYLNNYFLSTNPFPNSQSPILSSTLKYNYDIYWQYVVLLLHFNKLDTYYDQSIYKMQSSSINYPSISNTKLKFGNSSLYFSNYSNQYISYPISKNFSFGTSNYTIEFWFNWSGVYYTTLITTAVILGNSAWYIYISNNSLYFYSDTNSSVVFSSNTKIISNTWYNCCIVRKNNNIIIFINGNIESITNFRLNIDNDTYFPLIIGNNGISTNYFYGYIDEIRITKGIARYSSNYILSTAEFPSTAPTLLIPNYDIENLITNTILSTNNKNNNNNYDLNQLIIIPRSDIIYNISSSNNISNVFAFDGNPNTSWISRPTYANTVSTLISTSNNNISTPISGEWIQIELSTSFLLKSYLIQSSSTNVASQTPTSFYILGSIDNSYWTVIDSQANISWTTNNSIKTYDVKNNITSYNYYRFVGNAIGSTTTNSSMTIADIKFYCKY